MTRHSIYATVGIGVTIGLGCCAILYTFQSEMLLTTICAPPFFILQMLSCFVSGKIVFNDFAFVFELCFLEAGMLLMYEFFHARKLHHGNSVFASLISFGFSTLVAFMITSIYFFDGHSMGMFNWGKFSISMTDTNRNALKIFSMIRLGKELLSCAIIVFVVSKVLIAIKFKGLRRSLNLPKGA